MALFLASLNSGSNGNCYYIGNDQESVLIDAGISCREIEKRMKRLELDIKKVKAIFISHEHADHIRGLRVLSKKYNIPVYITIKTLANSGLYPHNPLFVFYQSNQWISVGNLSVKPFPKFHDAIDPHSFMVTYKDMNVGILTDIGEACENVISHFKMCDAAFLETNYDERLLENGRYPYFLKQRIRSKIGHLSNDQAYDLFTKHRSPGLTHLFLSHLSKDNNHPDLVKELFLQNSNGTEIIVASRYEETAVYEIKSK